MGDPVDDNIDHPPDLEEDKDETNDDDKEIMIPPDPAHEAKIAAGCSVYQKSRRPHNNAGRSFIMKNNSIGLGGVLPARAGQRRTQPRKRSYLH